MTERSWRGGARARAFRLGVGAGLVAALVGGSGCGMLRDAEDVRALPLSEAKFAIEAPCAAPAAQGAVEGAGRELELDVEQASQGPGDPWVLRRGARLMEPPLFYRVDVVAAERKDAALIRVYSVAVSKGVTDTHETMSKPAALAMRIVAACAAGGAP